MLPENWILKTSRPTVSGKKSFKMKNHSITAPCIMFVHHHFWVPDVKTALLHILKKACFAYSALIQTSKPGLKDEKEPQKEACDSC